MKKVEYDGHGYGDGMDGLLTVIVACVAFAGFIFMISRSVKPLVVIAVAVIVYALLRVTGVIG